MLQSFLTAGFTVDIFMEELDDPTALPSDPVRVDDNSDITKAASYGVGINVVVLDRRTVQMLESQVGLITHFNK